MPDPYGAKFLFRYLPLRGVSVSEATDLGPAGYRYIVTGLVGDQEVRGELLLSRMSAGSWYFAEPAEPPCVWLGRVWAGKA